MKSFCVYQVGMGSLTQPLDYRGTTGFDTEMRAAYVNNIGLSRPGRSLFENGSPEVIRVRKVGLSYYARTTKWHSTALPRCPF